MEINVAVVYTEYQLLQVEALLLQYGLKNVMLIIHNKNNRIQNWLIDNSLFDSVVQLPLKETTRQYKLSKAYIQYYFSVVTNILQKRKVKVLIGAQDENTIFAIIKHQAKPKYYWNIEDGNANYLRENLRYRMEIFSKKVLFAFYGYGRLDIRYGHGLVQSNRAFRLYPKLSVGSKGSIYMGEILRNYLENKVQNIRTKVSWVEQYKKYHTLVVSDVSCMPLIQKTHTLQELYKFHPENKVEIERIAYIKEHIPIEFLPWLLPDLKTVRFQIYSSSLLTMTVLHPGIRIQLDYLPPNKAYTYYTENIVNEFSNRIEVLKCWNKKSF